MRTIIAVALGAASLGGCATAVPSPPPVTSYAADACADAPDLASAIAMKPDKPKKKSFTLTTAVAATTPCLQWKGARGPHVLYSLPEERDGRLFEVGAALEPARIFSPAVVLLDAEGRETRAFPSDQYMYRGTVLSVQFLPRPEERFVLVAADPARVGQRYDSIVTSTSTTYLGTGGSWTSGHDRGVARGFSYEGAVVASVHEVKADKR